MKTEEEIRDAIGQLEQRAVELENAGINKGRTDKYATPELYKAKQLKDRARTLAWCLMPRSE